MNNKNIKRVFYLILLIGLSIFGIYMQFFYKSDKQEDEKTTWETTEEKQSILQDNELNEKGATEDVAVDMYDYSEKILPDVENETVEETYSEGMNIEIYFENADVLDEGSLPLEVHAKLTAAAQRYLFQNGYDDVTELYIDEKSYTEDEDCISFECFMDGYEKKLQIKYVIDESKLQFVIIKE